MISTLILTGCSIPVVRALRKRKRHSLPEMLNTMNKKLQLDEMVPKVHSLDVKNHKTTLSLWQENKGLNAKSQKTNHSIRKDMRLFTNYLLKYGKPYKKTAVVGGACLVSFGVYETVFANALKVIIEKVSSGKSVALAIPLLGSLLLVFPIIAILVIMGERISARVASRVVRDLNYDMFEQVQKLPVSFYQRTKLGDIMARFSSDMLYIRLGITDFIPTIAEIVVIIINVAFLAWLSWQMLLITLVALPLLVYVLKDFSPRLSEVNFSLKKEEASILNVVQEGVQAQPMIRSFGIQSSIQGGFARELNKLDNVTTEAIFNRASFERIITSSLFLAQLLSVVAGLILLGGGMLSVGALVSFILVQNIFSTNVRKLFRYRLNMLITSAVGLRRIDNFLQSEIKILDSVAAVELPAFGQNICFENVSFSYNEKKPQLKNISFNIEAGQFVAFVGSSGAGKSTILNLILRFYDVSHGKVSIDGYDLRDITQASLRKQMGIVLQDTFIFNASILENIRVVKPEATLEEVVQAAQAAELHDFIIGLPEGYQSSAGEAGKCLSGGQRQRIAIARAMLCDPEILILDEATSSLDAETAAAVDKTLHALSKERTVISISHHLKTVVKADNIFVLDKGEIAEQGRHEQLLSQQGLYAQLWFAQHPEMLDYKQIKEENILQLRAL